MSEAGSPIILIGGPTASGKSRLALRLAEEFQGTLINADSMQIYRDLSVLTARPDAAEMARVPHRLYGALDAREVCSAGRWRGMAEAEIAAARTAGRLPILVGGTGLYFRALLKGLAPVPAIPEVIRAEARARHRALGGAGFQALLAERDPESAARLHPSDRQRLVRAYEVVMATGRSLAEWQREQAAPARRRATAVLLLPPREALYAAIDRRVEAMMARGALAEARALLMRGLGDELPALRALGVAELFRHLRGEIDLQTAIAAMQQATRRYAKRQMSWFRRQMPPETELPALTLDAQFSESLLPKIFSFIRQFVLTVAPGAV